ncbi:hybrid sensor histidine kinase/response regulator [Halobiforma nitratireducens]|uniref:histidine kinase n=1 Tax=Halobiforma nitratireducens JCM 10879 TaxID=1227454 RepID=M0M0B1_9EURY|nr:hybrid sensor histidine kinase/response regulator [Halobiforma nitratireducens]EMA37820.1 response regulator receiver protein [Halobiforma nitratireducens JCM 10879]
MDPLETRSVLLVEDEDDDARLYRTMLQQLQADALEAASLPSIAVDRVENLSATVDQLQEDASAIDVVLLDLNLPDSSGLETLESVLEQSDGTAVVVLTGIDDGAIGLEAVERGAEDFLVKDHVTPRVLTRTINYAIERKRRTLELERQRRELAVLNWLIRHEIRDDAAVILGWIEALDPDDPTEERIVSRIVEAGEHVVELTESVGAMVEALEEPAATLDTVVLEAVLQEEIARLETRYEDLDVALDGADGTTRVRADRFLNVVVRNVLTNAVVHDDTGTPEPTVTVVTGQNNDELVGFQVADSGPGLPTANRRRVVDRGWSGVDERTGIGLYLVRTFVDRYGGRLEIDDNEPRGTIVRILLEPAE